MSNYPIALIIAFLSFIGTMICKSDSTLYIACMVAYMTSMIILIGSGFTKQLFKGDN